MSVFFVSCAIGFEDELEQEIQEFWPYLLAKDGRPHAEPLAILEKIPGGLEIECSEIVGFQINLFTKIAHRVLLRLASKTIKDFPPLVAWVKKLPLKNYFAKFDFDYEIAASKSRLNNEKRILKIFEEVLGPAREGAPKIFVRVYDDQFTVSLDTTGEHLHFRGQRTQQGTAPLRETIAAFCLRRLFAGVSLAELSKMKLIDPMCGAGTFLLEAPNLYTPNPRGFSFQKFQSCPALLKSETLTKNYRGFENVQLAGLAGADLDPEMIQITKRNLVSAGIEASLEVQDLAVTKSQIDAQDQMNLVVVNPPYGERIKTALSAHDVMEKCLTLYRPERCLIIHPHSQWPQQMIIRGAKYALREKIKALNGGLSVYITIYQKSDYQEISP